MKVSGTIGLLCACAAMAQVPAVNPRGVLNAITLEPAPTRVTPRGILRITGANLGPATAITAPADAPLPTVLGDPETEVLIGGRPAPLYSISQTLILAQVPQQTPQGTVNVVVRRGENRSRPVGIRVVNLLPAVRSKNERGYGEAAGAADGSRMVLAVTGLGNTDPGVPAGRVAPEDGIAPAANILAWIGGRPATATATLSRKVPGEFDVAVETPADAKPGDVLTIRANNVGTANLTTVGQGAADRLFVRLPTGAQAIRVLRPVDLRSTYILGSAARGEDGCFPTWRFDLERGESARVEECLIAANANVQTPIVNPVNLDVAAAFVGPAEGTAQEGISAKVVIFNPALDAPLVVELPGKASNLNANAQGMIVATRAGGTPYQIDPATGEVSELDQPAGGGGAGAGGAAGGGAPGGQQGLLQALGAIDLGEGLTKVISPPAALGAGIFGVLVADDTAAPTKAKFAFVNAAGEVQSTADLPSGWLPLVPPAPPALPGGPGGPGGGAPGIPPGGAGGAGANNPLANLRVQPILHAASRRMFILARGAEADGMIMIQLPGLEVSSISLPEGWFHTSCSAAIRSFNLEISNRLAFFGTRVRETAFRQACQGQGFLILDPAAPGVTAVNLPGESQINVNAASGDVNDYLYATNADPANANRSDIVYAYDSPSGAVFRLDLPPGVIGFQGLQPITELSSLIASGVGTQVAGDGGLILFDLDKEKSTLLPVPDGFQTIQNLGVFPATRKLLARGVKPGAAGTEYLIFDLDSGELTMPGNPEGVEFVGPLPAAGGQGGAGGGQGGAGGGQAALQVQFAQPRANWVVAMGFNAQRQPAGIVAIRVP